MYRFLLVSNLYLKFHVHYRSENVAFEHLFIT